MWKWKIEIFIRKSSFVSLWTLLPLPTLKALLRHNLYNMKFTHCNGTIQCFSVIVRSCATINTLQLRHFHYTSNSLVPFCRQFISSFWRRQPDLLLSLHSNLPFSENLIWASSYVVFCVQLLSLSVIFLILKHFVAFFSSSFLFYLGKCLLAAIDITVLKIN